MPPHFPLRFGLGWASLLVLFSCGARSELWSEGAGYETDDTVNPGSGGAGALGGGNGSGAGPLGVGGAGGWSHSGGAGGSGVIPAAPGWGDVVSLPGGVDLPTFGLAMADTGDAVLFRQRTRSELERLRFERGWSEASEGLVSQYLGGVWISRDGSIDWVSFFPSGPASSATFNKGSNSHSFMGPIALGVAVTTSFPELRAEGVPKTVALSQSGEKIALVTDQSEILSSSGGPWDRAKWEHDTVGPFALTEDRMSVLVTSSSGAVVERSFESGTWTDHTVASPIHLGHAWPTLESLTLTSHSQLAFATWSATLGGAPVDYLGRKSEFGNWQILSSWGASPVARRASHQLAVSADGRRALTSHIPCSGGDCARDQIGVMLFEGEELSLTRLTLSPGCATAAVALAAEARRGYFAVRCGDSIHLGAWSGAKWETRVVRPLAPPTFDPDVVTSGDGSQALFVWAEADGERHVHKSLLFVAN